MQTLTVNRKNRRHYVAKHLLAQAYSPEITPHAALKKLGRWIQSCQPLTNALKRSGYNGNSKFFSQWQTTLIFRYLGEP